MDGRWSKLAVAAICLAGAAAALAAGPEGKKHGRKQTLDELTAHEETERRPDGTVLYKRAFKHGIPWEEYQAALAAENDNTFSEENEPLMTDEPGGGGGGGGGGETSASTCNAPDSDYDGDGFTLTTPTQDLPPLRAGEHIADRPRLFAEFKSTIHPYIEKRLVGTTAWQSQEVLFNKNDLVQTFTSKESVEIKSKFNTGEGIKLNFGFSGLKPTFNINPFSLGYEFEKTRNYTWTRDKTRTVQDTFTVTRTENQEGRIEYNEAAGKVTGDVIIYNKSNYSILLTLTNVRVAVVAYSPFTGIRHVIGEVTIQNPFDLNWGAGNDFYWNQVTLNGINTAEMVDKLADGWVFDFEIASPPAAIERGTGADVGALISQINQRNARIVIHYGDAMPRQYGQVSVFGAAAGSCLTAKEMLETFVPAGQVEFERMADGTLVVKRINHRSNRFADRDFDSLTPAEQAQYGRWIVGASFANQAQTIIDLETTELRPEDQVFFFYITGQDFTTEARPHDVEFTSSLANDGSSPASATVTNGVSTNDILQLEVRGSFQIESAYTTPPGTADIVACGKWIYNYSYHGHQVTTDSDAHSITIPDADWYGVQVKFGGQPWKTIADILAEPTAQARIVSFRGYPWYDYVLEFRASPVLLGNYPSRNFQVQNVKPRQTFYPVGYSGRDVFSSPTTCYWTETGGRMRHTVRTRVWYKLDNADSDLDGFYASARTGIDFDDTNARRFPFAPEHLDGLDNEGNGAVDDHPLLCPASVPSYDEGTCDLDDRLGWYGATPNVSFDRRFTLTGGGTTAWEAVGSGITSYTFTMPGNAGYQAMQVRATHTPPTGGTFSGVSSVLRTPGTLPPMMTLGVDFPAENGALVLPMQTGVAGSDTFIHVPSGSTNYPDASADYRIAIAATGDYQIWTRVYAANAQDDSIFVQVLDQNGTPVSFTYGGQAHFRFERANPAYTYGAFGWTRVGHWNPYVTPEQVLNPITWHLTPGTYTIRITPRELGSRIDTLRVDRLCPDADGDGYTVCQGDCNDSNSAVRPGRSEVCSNGIDDDCDGYVNEGCGGGGSPVLIKYME